MCLWRVDLKLIPSQPEIEAWKVFGTCPDGTLRALCFRKLEYREVGRWEQATGEDYWSHETGTYKVGFHALATKQNALDLLKVIPDPRRVVRKVRLRHLVAAGIGDGFTNNGAVCFVAREMMILPEEPSDAKSE